MGNANSGRRPNPMQPRTLAAARVLEHCTENAMRHTDIARSIGMDPGNFRRVLLGERKCTLELAVAVEDLLSIPPRQWLEELYQSPIIVQE